MADKKKSVADILAAARKADSKGDAADNPPAETASASPIADEAASSVATEKPSAAPAKKPAGGGGRPSVADMLAMARGEKQGGAAAAAPKPAAKPAAPAAK